jgi:RNA polymerase primary sigma factor
MRGDGLHSNMTASEGHRHICSTPREAAAARDSERSCAIAVALLCGPDAIAEELRDVGAQLSIREDGDGGEGTTDASLDNPKLFLNTNEAFARHPAGAVEPLLDAPISGSEIVESVSSISDEDGVFNHSAWQEQLDTRPPADDPTCADGARDLQATISRHLPIDMDASWDDVEIDLPDLADLAGRRFRLTGEAKEALRKVLVEALRDGRVQSDRIGEVLGRKEGLGDAEELDLEAGLRLALSDLGTVIDDNFLAPDAVIEANEYEEEQFGEIASDAINFIARLQSSDADPLAHFGRHLPTKRLTREEETALGMAMEEGRIEILAAIIGSSAAVSKILSDSQAVLTGALPARAMLDYTADQASEEDISPNEGVEEEEASDVTTITPLPAELRAHLTAIADLCRQTYVDRTHFAQQLLLARLMPDYLVELRDIAESDAAAGDVVERIRAGVAKADRAKKYLVEPNLRLVVWLAKRHGGLSLLDRIQEGSIGLMRAADRFDPVYGARFSTYAVWSIKQAMTRGVADTHRTIRLPVHVHESLRKVEKARVQAQYESSREPEAARISVLAGLPEDKVRKLMRVPEEPLSFDTEPEIADILRNSVDDTIPSPEDMLIAANMQMLVRKQLDCLEPREDFVIRQRFGIDCDERTLEEIGQIYGVTRERIRQIEAKALKKLGHPSRVERLLDELR